MKKAILIAGARDQFRWGGGGGLREHLEATINIECHLGGGG